MTIEMISDEDIPMWHGYLYQLQQEAPRPMPVVSNRPETIRNRPPYFGEEYHGLISREEGDARCSKEGSFLVRESMNERGRYTLVLKLLGTVKNFKLYWENGQFFVGDKRFDHLYELVEDGLITMYVEEKGRDYIQNMSKDRSVYSSLSKTKRLLTKQLPGNEQYATSGERRGSPARRAASVRVGPTYSPRYGHNGRNTESAALPYTHYSNGGREYCDSTYNDQTTYPGEANTVALEEQLNATHMMKDSQSFLQPQSLPHVAYYNPNEISGSMIQMLQNSRPYENTTFQEGKHDSHIGVGGAKKSLTPTSSDERKRPKAKKAATERTIAQQQAYYQHEHHMSHDSYAYDIKNQYEHGRSMSASSGSNTDSEGRRPRLPPRTHVPSQLKNRPFHQSAPSYSPSNSPHRSPMKRNNSDATFGPAQRSIMAQLNQSNMAHSRQLENTVSNGHDVTGAHHPDFYNSDNAVEKIFLDANENQLRVSTVVPQSRFESPSHMRQSPRQQPDFDSSSGSEAFPAKTFQQLKMVHKRMEEDEDMRKEAQDEVTTLRGQPKPHPRLSRSHTTVGMTPVVRPHSGGKAHPRPAPREIHHRQRSEPVELFLHNTPNQVIHANHLQYRVDDPQLVQQQQFRSARQRDFYNNVDQGDLRAPSSGSCDSSLSNLSSSGSNALPHVSESYFKHPLDSISHLSSEDWTGEERESSPSPHSTTRRSFSSDDNSLPKSRDLRSQLALERHNATIAMNEHPESRDKITALQGQSPKLKRDTKDYTSSMPYNGNSIGFVPPPEALNGTKPRRKNSDHVNGHISNKDSKSRHSSETSSEEGTIKTPAPNHKPLQRRATTGSSSPNKNSGKINGSSPVKLPVSKKPALRSNSGPSLRKGKRSPDGTSSPTMQHTHHQRSLSSPRSDCHYYDKEHVFKSHTYRGLQWCEYCGNFMWGIIQQGMQCRDCGLNVHKQCSKLVPGDCQPALKHVKTVFGIDLTALVKLHGTERPIVIDKCIAEIERRGMGSEGLYRVSGFHDDVQRLKIAFDRYGNDVDMSSYDDINTVAGGLKLYLRELPVPLIPYNLYSRFINAAKLSYTDGKLEAVRTALDVMPPAHLQTLKHIILHLGRVCDRLDNQMDAQNLGIVFGPTMLRPPEKSAPSRYNLDDTQYQKEIVQTIIDNRRELFGGSKKDIPIRETHNL